MEIAFEHSTLPVLHACDAVIVGGSFAGIAAALALAQAGYSVTVLEPRTYLGREMTATLRPWLRVKTTEDLPAILRSALTAAAVPVNQGEYAFNLDNLKVHLEDILLAAGVRLLYASLPVGLDIIDGGLRGVIIGNKSGRQIIACSLLLDTSATALVARLAGASFATIPPHPAPYRRTLEFDGVATSLDLSEPLQVAGQRATLHAGYRARGHVLVECELMLAAAYENGFELSARETLARHQTMRFVAELVRQVPAFAGAYLAGTSYELYGPHTPPLAPAEAAPSWARAFEQIALPHDEQVRLSDFAGSVPGLWYLNEAIALGEHTPENFFDPVSTTGIGADLGHLLGQHWTAARALHTPVSPTPITQEHTAGGMRVREPDSPQRSFPYERRAVDPIQLPVLRHVDVLVVGGGTSGATAAITAAGAGVSTLLLEMNPGLGGTATYGGVHSYWFGQRYGFADRIMRLVNDMHEELCQPQARGLVPKWNIEAKSYALLREAEAQGVEVLTNCLVIGTLVDGEQVAGVVVATRTGPALIRASITIDASGDGDVAYFGGADYIYGNERDHVTMWYALAQFARPGLTRNHFTSMVDVGNIEDYTRAILAGRRRGRDDQMHDHGIYVAPRESRHIRGEYVLTLTDQLRHRRWPDVVNIAFSNHDVKGHSGSDWLRVGLIPPNLEIEIPYRALLPARLKNILVVGKAFSADHDALPAIRMQADLENLGGVAGLAAAQVVQQGVALDKIDLQRLQARLIEANVLPPDVLTRHLTVHEYSNTELQTLIDNLPVDKPLYDYSEMEMTERYTDRIPMVEICCAGPRVIPLLTKALHQAEGPHALRLAQALALVGSGEGMPVLVSAIEEQLQANRLPVRTAHIRYTQLPPDHGAMPDVVYLLYSLALAPDVRAIPTWQRVIDLLAYVTKEDFLSQEKGIFYYVDAVCCGAERLADAGIIPGLIQLHGYPIFHDRASYAGFQPDYIEERLAYLELVIGRALARCASPDGFAILISYLNDNRALLAEHAHSELVAITAVDYGKDTRQWASWLEDYADTLTPQPWRPRSDPMRAWDTTIYTQAGD